MRCFLNFGVQNNLLRQALSKSVGYWNCLDAWQIDLLQTKLFCAIWKDVIANVPYYEKWKVDHRLPDKIESIHELEHWPVLRKPEIQANRDLFVRRDRKADSYTYTGGATGEPLHFGTFRSFGRMTSQNMWVGRTANGVMPEMRCFLLWGHTHLWGKGLSGLLRRYQRLLKDWLSNKYRISAIDLDTDRLYGVCRKLLAYRPEYIIAYSRSLLAFCRANTDLQRQCAELKLKTVICSAGNLSDSERTEMARFFECPVALEYGSMECGVMAYTTPALEGRYRTFSDTHLLQAVEDGDYKKIIVTALTDSYFPLIRYEIGDYFDQCHFEKTRVDSFGLVVGRSSDLIVLANGTRFHGVIFMAAVEQVPKVLAYQTIIYFDRIELHVVVKEPLSSSEKSFLIGRSQETVPALRNWNIQVVEKKQLIRAPSGKIRLVVYDTTGSK